MAIAANDLRNAALTACDPYWLTFAGKSGTGKTFLMDLLMAKALKNPALTLHPVLIVGIMRAHWPTLLDQLRDKQLWRLDDLAEAHLTFIDEISFDHDPGGFGREKLCNLLSLRSHKWTLLTSNLMMPQIGAVDGRIASRMIRDGNVVVDCVTTDFARRQ